MNAEATVLLTTLRAMGLRISLTDDGYRVACEAASGVECSDEDVAALRRLKPAILALLASERRQAHNVLGMPLDEFKRTGDLLEVTVPWLPVTLWFVPAASDAIRLVSEGISRGRIWTAGELMDLLAIAGLTANEVMGVARAKVEFGADVLEVPRTVHAPRDGRG